jgi:hypothetical protein
MENGFVQNAASGPLQQDNQILRDMLEGATTCQVHKSIGDSPWEKPEWLPMPICCSLTGTFSKVAGNESSKAKNVRQAPQEAQPCHTGSACSGCHCQKDGHYWKLKLGTSGMPKS